MKRPCHKRHPEPVTGCVLCHLFLTSPLHANLWGNPKPPGEKSVAATKAALPCIHFGAATGETVKCPTCKGSVTLKLFECSVYGRCTLGKRVKDYGCCDSSCTARQEITTSS